MWKPIETAPLDGTPVLLYVPGIRSWNRKSGMPEIVVGLWENTIGSVSFDGGQTWNDGGWFSDVGDIDQGYESTGAWFEHEYLQPSHWMELPDPPPDPVTIDGTIEPERKLIDAS